MTATLAAAILVSGTALIALGFVAGYCVRASTERREDRDELVRRREILKFPSARRV